jgi:hypothetical protein
LVLELRQRRAGAYFDDHALQAEVVEMAVVQGTEAVAAREWKRDCFDTDFCRIASKQK